MVASLFKKKNITCIFIIVYLSCYHIFIIFLAIICFCGRSAALYQHQGEGTDLYIQNGTDPVDDSIKIPHLQSGITSTQWTKGKCFPTMGTFFL